MRQVMLKDAGCDILRLNETLSWASPFLLAVKMTRTQMPVLFYHIVIHALGFFFLLSDTLVSIYIYIYIYLYTFIYIYLLKIG